MNGRLFRGFDLLARALAAACERAPWLIELFVRALPRGRYWIAAHVEPSRMPARVTVCRDNLRFELDPRETVQRLIYFGALERRELKACIRAVSPGDTVADVGANVGYYALALARRVGPSGHVHAFEPDPSLAARLERHLAINRLSEHVTVHRQAVGGKRGRADFLRADEDNLGGGTLIPYADLQRATFPVDVVTLDEVCVRHGISRLALLKVDVEGAEVDVLGGAARLLDRAAIRHVLVELNGWRLHDRGMRLEDLTGPLLARGYVLDRLNSSFVENLAGGRRSLRSVVTNLLFHAPGATGSS